MKLTPNDLYKILLEEFGRRNWWPMDKTYHERRGSDPRFEIIVGAILTQNTAWSNVEKALTNLKSNNMLEIQKISGANINKLQTMIKPSGFFNQKAERLKTLASYLHKNYHDNLDDFFNRNVYDLREELLSLKGIGLETADSILLYAGNLPIFVIDAYTKRICKRLPLKTPLSYDDIQRYFEMELSNHQSKQKITRVYNELHALIVELAKQYCKKKPECSNCPLRTHCIFHNQLSK
jgi:endonuclease-3 related protein